VRRASPGQALVEFALASTAFLLLAFGIMEMSLAVYSYNTICSAAREAVRFAIVHSPTGPNPATTAQIQQVAIDYAPALNLNANEIVVSWPADPTLPSQLDAQVSISHAFTLQIPFILTTSLALSNTSQMLVSQ
jgi:Flp pilus assembly protein TadG